MKEAWWRKTNEITVIDQTNTWKYNGYGERPQVECYSMQNFDLPLGIDLEGVSYVSNDHNVDVEGKKCLYLDLVYPDKKHQCKAFVTPILLSHRYYLTNIHNLDDVDITLKNKHQIEAYELSRRRQRPWLFDYSN